MDTKEFYIECFKEKPEAMFDCGGRFEILGNHTDHNHGLCLAATADLCVTAGISKSNDLNVDLFSEGFEPVHITLDNLEVNPSDTKSGAMIRGVAKYLSDRGFKIGGFKAACTSTIYAGAGLSSSAAFELLIGQIFNELFNEGKIDRLLLCKAGQFSENNYFGKKSGLLDQIGVGYGNIVSIDFENIAEPKVNQITFPFTDIHFVSVNTGGDHSNLNDLYSSIPTDMYNAAHKAGVNFLRETSLEKVKASKEVLPNELSRATHFFGENQRVLDAMKALKENDKKAFLDAVNGSRISSTNNLKNMMIEGHYNGSPLEACDLAMKAMYNEGACKINGGGFAGSIICLVPEKYLENFIEKMSSKYGTENVREIFVRKFGPRKY